MFGLEKKKELFKFDLQKDLEKHPAKVKELLKQTEATIAEIKNALRQGAGSADFDQLGVLLNGYTALQRVLTRMQKKK